MRTLEGVAWYRLAAGVIPAAFLFSPVAAQKLPLELPALEARSPVQRAEIEFLAGRPGNALALLESHLATGADGYEVRWRAAQAALVLGVIDTDADGKSAYFSRAVTHGEAAVALDPDGIDGLYWTAAATGRAALQHGPRTSTRMVQRVWDLTHRVLELDPSHPGAHNILGKLNHEVMALSKFERFVARLLFSIDPLRDASWDRALHHHGAAVTAAPDVVLFRKDLGETLAALGQHAEAREHFEVALGLPDAWPVDAPFKQEIREHLARLPSS